jgi:hypothetical protein
MTTNPLNCVECTLRKLTGTTSLVKTVASKIVGGLTNEGFAVINTAEVDRLHLLLTNLRDVNSDEFDEALEIVGGWK